MSGGSVPMLAKLWNHALSAMRDIHCWMNALRFCAVASGLFGGESHEPSVTVGALAPVGSADAVFVAAAIKIVSVDETSSASTRFGRMGAPRRYMRKPDAREQYWA